MIPKRSLVIASSLAISTLLGACSSSPVSEFYTLSDNADTPPAKIAKTEYSIVVGPVTVPESVDRPQLVLRVSGNQVNVVERVRWVEPLRSAIPRVIASNLGQQLNTTRVWAYPRTVDGADYQVLLDVLRFESVMGESATLEVTWIVRPSIGGELKYGRALAREPTDGAGYGALVAAHARALVTVSRQIAESMHK